MDNGCAFAFVMKHDDDRVLNLFLMAIESSILIG